VIISHHDAHVADGWFARHGDSTIFFTRLMPVVRTFISLPAGIARMNFRTFLVFTFLGSLPWCALLGYAGYKLGEHWHDVGSALHQSDLLIGVVLVALGGWFVYRHVKRFQSADDIRSS